ncbi:putative NAD-P-binding protein [Lyophyllum shimeji]|uniref:NAD-P-binding protein n=1 Tax=Lyophyllum shimeji TaxID=47721 RepID=A0A9P3PRD8_LYOSH|nr:putative NAD-P-binding protein [Lyophyllum shimeji]
MSTTKTNILVTGATGYIGGAVLSRFLARPDISSLSITALVRSPEKSEKLKALGVNAVVGSHENSALVQKLASEADVVLSMADSDHIEAAKAILRGLEARYKATGTAPVLIHTSGTGVLMDNAAGAYAYDTIYDDATPAQIETLAPTQLHRDVDLILTDADRLGYVKTYIILPCTIYGIATGTLAAHGIQNVHSVQIPSLIRASLDRGQGGMVGLGKNRWNNVSIDDVADVYLVLYDAIRTNPATGHGREGYYFAENGEHTLYDVGKAIAEALVALGRGKSAEPTTFTKEEIDKYFQGSEYLGSNSRCRATRARAIGWKPTKTAKDMLASIRPEVEALLRKMSA